MEIYRHTNFGFLTLIPFERRENLLNNVKSFKNLFKYGTHVVCHLCKKIKIKNININNMKLNFFVL